MVALLAHGDEMRDDLRDIRGVVAHALDIGDHLHGGRNVAQVARYRLLAQQQGHAAVLNVPLHVVDAVIPLHDLLGGCGVGGAQRFQRVLHGLGGVLPHLHQSDPEGFQIAVVLFANAHCFVPPCINRTGRRCSPRCACPGAC